MGRTLGDGVAGRALGKAVGRTLAAAIWVPLDVSAAVVCAESAVVLPPQPANTTRLAIRA